MALRKKLKLTPVGTETIQESHSTCCFRPEMSSDRNFTSSMEITSKYFTPSLSQMFLNVELQFNQALRSLTFGEPVAAVYNPVEYAFEVHQTFVKLYLNGPKKILFLGMNPGPWGMCQTGVPFGSVAEVRDWLNISGPVSVPPNEIPARPITGFQCTRSEVSGKRFWGLWKELCDSPEAFFKDSFVHNLCPLLLVQETGKNITPAELKGDEKRLLLDTCERFLIPVLRCLGTKLIVAVGKFAETRSIHALKAYRKGSEQVDCRVVCLPHPSPRTVGNTNWNETAIKSLRDLNLLSFYKTDMSANTHNTISLTI